MSRTVIIGAFRTGSGLGFPRFYTRSRPAANSGPPQALLAEPRSEIAHVFCCELLRGALTRSTKLGTRTLEALFPPILTGDKTGG